MLMPPPTVRVFLAREPADLRRGFDGLAALTRDVIRQSPLSGHLFVFRNRSGNRVKILYWDRSGYCLWYKRLEAGTFRFPCGAEPAAEIDAADLMLLLEGIDPTRVVRSKRFRLPASTGAEGTLATPSAPLSGVFG